MSELEVSQSKLRSWRRCHAAYNYGFIENLERNRPKVQLLRGSMIGDCIDDVVWRRLKPLDTKVHYSETLGKYLSEYRRLFDEEKEYYGDIVKEVGRIVFNYEKLYRDDGLTYHIQEGRSAELKVRVELAPGIVFTGSIDKYPMDKQGRYWVMDHKSHKNIPDEEARFADLQLVFYFWGAPLSGFPKPTGVVWDYLRTKPPAIPQLLKNGELTQRANIDTDYDTYMDTIVQNKLNPKDYQGILKPLKERGSQDFFKRVWLPSPSKALVKSIVEDAKITAQEIKHLAGKSKTRSMTRDCKQCNFYTLCQAEVRGLDADFIRKTEYHQRKVKEVLRHGNQEDDGE